MYRTYNPNFNYPGELLFVCGGSRGKKRKAWYPPANPVHDKKNPSPVDEKQDKKISGDKRLNNPLYLLEYYVSRSSVHGVRYILDPELYTVEKIIWLIFVIVSISFTAQVIVQLASEFQAAPTVVVIESTSYRVSSLPFPSVTICPRERVDWKKAMALEKKIIPSNNPESIKLYRNLITILSSMPFARFSDVSFLKNTSLTELADVNVTDIMYKVVPSCKDLFTSCWWRYYTRDCCEIFQLQKSEYGFCYSFNSATSEDLSFVSRAGVKSTSGFGDRSGLKVTVHLGNITFPPSSRGKILEKFGSVTKKEKEGLQDLYRGATILINHPEDWPSSGRPLGAGMSISVNVKCTSGYATQDVLNLKPDKIPCRYKKLHMDAEYKQETCISECRRRHVKKHCECNPSYYFPATETRECKVKDFICLVEHNEIFTNYQILGDNQRVEKDEPIMFCDCPPACNFSTYETNMVTIPIDEEQDIMLDVHFDGPTSIRYKMNVVVTGLSLLVSFGGIFGLFVGGSIISIFEVIYLFGIGTVSRFYLCLKAKRKRILNARTAVTEAQIYRSDFPPLKSKIFYTTDIIQRKI